MFIVTKEWIEDNRLCTGGWSTVQVKLLGWSSGLRTKNWKRRSVGLMITDEVKEAFEDFGESKTRARKVVKQSQRLKGDSRISQEISAARVHGVEFTKSFIQSVDFLKTMEWARVRMSALQKYGTTCMCCGATKESATICVDHIKPRKFYPELALSLDNLQILCEPCNRGKGNIDNTDWRG